jgi:hypothetical protein
VEKQAADRQQEVVNGLAALTEALDRLNSGGIEAQFGV